MLSDVSSDADSLGEEASVKLFSIYLSLADNKIQSYKVHGETDSGVQTSFYSRGKKKERNCGVTCKFLVSLVL